MLQVPRETIQKQTCVKASHYPASCVDRPIPSFSAYGSCNGHNRWHIKPTSLSASVQQRAAIHKREKKQVKGTQVNRKRCCKDRCELPSKLPVLSWTLAVIAVLSIAYVTIKQTVLQIGLHWVQKCTAANCRSLGCFNCTQQQQSTLNKMTF